MTDQDARSFRAAHSPVRPAGPRFLFVLLPGYGVTDVALATEALDAANRDGGDFRWRILTVTGAGVPSRSGLTLAVDGGVEPVFPNDTLLLCGGPQLVRQSSPALAPWLGKAVAHGAAVGAIGSGGSVLAEAGLLEDIPIATHWAMADPMRERLPRPQVTDAVFHFGPRRITCAGGVTTLDMMLALIAAAQGRNCAHAAAAALTCAHIRGPDAPQMLSTACRHARRSPALIAAIKVMEATLDDPLPAQAVAEKVGLSCRHLERLFSTHLGQTPKRFQDGLRLDHGRRLIQQTDLGVAEISVACGFRTQSHFARLYRRRFGVTPSADRGLAPVVA
ncbi:GlxA family transcriptional regulator [Roseovarius sp. SYSU LYC5161]|uniref:GlxA family transcriptional regulator n=1 Tax=Roseovarius halophilus (ex Wu et al. 2025) TaxID=3376060 RepID=UPI00399BEBB9